MNGPSPHGATNDARIPSAAVTPTPDGLPHHFLDQKEVYLQILDAIDDMILVKGERSRIVWANRAFRDYYGMSNRQLRDLIDAPFNEEENTKQYVRDDHYVFSTGQTLKVPVETVIRHDGTPQVFNTVKSAIRDSDGRVRLTVGVSRNITEQQRIEQELARHREQLEGLVQERTKELHELSGSLQVIISSLVEGIIAVDAAGCVKMMNPAAETFIGQTGGSAEGRALAEVLHLLDETTGKPLAESGGIRALLGPDRSRERLVARLRGAPGTERIVAVSTSRLVGEGGAAEGSVVILRDITAEREAEDQRLRHQRLESLGLLAGGIAHDFNNILTAILGNISVSRLQVPPGCELATNLEHAEYACGQAQGLAKQLLTFAKGGAPVKKVLRLEETVKHTAELALRGSRVQLQLRLADGIHPVEADEGQIGQVVNNIVLNAKQAMPAGGSVTVTVANALASETAAFPLAPGVHVRVSIEDTGHGIAPEHLAKIFDPYFTTKEQGTGLGLASAHSIISRHGGFLTVSAPPGAGACFTFYLPAVSARAPEQPEVKPLASAGTPKDFLILDDNVAVRDVLKVMLRKLGHRASVVGSSAEAFAALAEAERAGHPFAAIFVDLTMPGDLPGDEVIARLQAQECPTKIIAMSGYSSNPIMANYRELGLLGALPKPFNIQALREVLARA